MPGTQGVLFPNRSRKVKSDHAGSTEIPRGQYFGGKGADGTYQTLINLIPPHETYISLFAGKCAVRYHMKLCTAVYMFDLDESIVKWWRTWRKTKPGILTFDAQCRNALEVLDEPWLISATWLSSTFIFLDPPFPHSTRHNAEQFRYRHELTDADHVKLCKVLHKDYRDCKVMLCSIENDIYDKHLKGWYKVKYFNMTRAGRVEECLYMNYPPPDQLHDYSFLGDDFEQRRRIKRKVKRHVEKLRKLPVKERNAIIHAIQLYNKHIFSKPKSANKTLLEILPD